MTTPEQRAALRRLKAIQDANDYIASRVWRLEDETADLIRAETQLANDRLAQALTLLFLTYVVGETWSASDSAYRQRTDSFNATILAEIETLTNKIAGITLDSSIRSYQAGNYGAAWTLGAAARASVPGATLPALPLDAIRAAILSPYKGGTFLDRFQNARDEFVSIIKKSIVESQILGESIRQATRRLRAGLGLDGQSPTAYRNRVEMIARTEILRSSNTAAMEYYAKSEVLKGWEWKATNDERTCIICGNLDGQFFTFDSVQEQPPDGSHPNCRCTPLPVLTDSALEAEIVGPRVSYRDWASANGLNEMNDGGVL